MLPHHYTLCLHRKKHNQILKAKGEHYSHVSSIFHYRKHLKSAHCAPGTFLHIFKLSCRYKLIHTKYTESGSAVHNNDPANAPPVYNNNSHLRHDCRNIYTKGNHWIGSTQWVRFNKKYLEQMPWVACIHVLVKDVLTQPSLVSTAMIIIISLC